VRFDRPCYTVWKWKEQTEGSEHPCSSEVSVVDNLLQKYMKPFDVPADSLSYILTFLIGVEARSDKGPDYRTMWVMAHKIRSPVADRDSHYRLAGLVEVDESLFGPSSPGKTGRGAERKSVVIVAVSTWMSSSGKEEPGFAHAFVAEDASADTIEALLNGLPVPVNEVKPGITSLRSDRWRSYQKVPKKLGAVHYRAILSDPKDSMKLLAWTHRLIANAKAAVSGPRRGVSDKHLQRYISEVCYRFNCGFWPEESFHRLLNACATTTTVAGDQLMAPVRSAEQFQQAV
jgi:hypothetical protein